MDHYRQQVAAALRAGAVHSPTSYSWFGHKSRALPRSVKRALTDKTARHYLLFHLQMRLYCDFYRHGFASQTSTDIVGPPAVGRTPFVEALSTANCGHGCWENGWTVLAVEDEQVAVRRDGLTLLARREDCLPVTVGPPEIGGDSAVRFPKELCNISPGFYMVHSDCPLTYDRAQTVVRFYWNLTAEGAVAFVPVSERSNTATTERLKTGHCR